MNCSTPVFPVLHYFPEFTQTHVNPTISFYVVPFSSCLQFLPASGSFPRSQFFTSGGQNIGVSPFSISPSNEYSRWISFRMDWLDLLIVQGTLKSLLQHHSSKESILQSSAFFYGPALTSVCDYWKNYSFEYTDLCWLSDVPAFSYNV